MKKVLAITLSLALLITACFCVPMQSASAVTGTDIANGNWYDRDGNGPVAGSNGSVTMPDWMDYRGFWTKISGLNTNTEYELTFNFTASLASAIEKVSVVPVGNLSNPYKNADGTGGSDVLKGDDYASYTKDTANSKIVVSFTTDATNSDYFLAIKVGNLTTACVFSNFTIRELSADEIAGMNTLGNWNKGGQGNFTVNKATRSVTYTGVQYQSICTTLTGLKTNTTYILAFDHTSTGAQYLIGNPIDISTGELTWDASSGSYRLANKITTLNESETNTSTGKSVTFTTDSVNTTYNIAFILHGLNDVTISNITLHEVTAAEVASAKILDSWKKVGAENVSVNKADGTVSFTSALSQVLALDIKDLKPATTYTLKFNYSGAADYQFGNPTYVTAGGAESWTVQGDKCLPSNGYKTVDYSKYNSGSSRVITFTTLENETAYSFGFLVQQVSSVTLSNFTFTEVGAVNTFNGTAMRAASGDVAQGMRFKNTISADALANGINGSAVARYGSIAAITENLEDVDFVLDNADENIIKTGEAYNKAEGLEKTFDVDAAGNKIFTAVLTGIPASAYDVEFSVRPYIVLEDGTEIYGEVQTYCVYLVFYGIENGTNENDKAVLANILTDGSIANDYANWKTANADILP